MLVWAIAALMKRRSRMAEVIAAVPRAAQATWRMKLRRGSRTEDDFGSIRLFLDGVVGGRDDQMDHATNAVEHLGTGGRAVRKVGGVGDVVDDGRLRAGGQLA